MGRFFSATTFLGAGNITHTPAYGHMIALGIQHAVTLCNASEEQVRNVRDAYRILYRSELKLAEALEKLSALGETQPEVRAFVDFIAASTRSIVR